MLTRYFSNLNFFKPVTNRFTTLEVIVSQDLSPQTAFDIAVKNQFLTSLGDGQYKCRRILAENLNLSIISNYPV
jgi:hypothetical protein